LLSGEYSLITARYQHKSGTTQGPERLDRAGVAGSSSTKIRIKLYSLNRRQVEGTPVAAKQGHLILPLSRHICWDSS